MSIALSPDHVAVDSGVPRYIRLAHNEFHRQRADRVLPVERLVEIGDILCAGALPDLQLDAGWAWIQAARSSGRQERRRLFEQAQGIWSDVKLEAPHGDFKLRAMRDLAFLAFFESGGRQPDAAGLAKGMASVNNSFMSWSKKLRAGVGTGHEIPVIQFLNGYNATTKGKRRAWPAEPWQDAPFRTKQHGPTKGFDVAYGQYPNIEHRLQVKTSLYQEGLPESDYKGSEEDVRRAWQREYGDDITLIFASIHLGSKEDPWQANKLINGADTQAVGYRIGLMTAAILREMEATDHRINA